MLTTLDRQTKVRPRLIGMHDAAIYLGVSYWSVRDMVLRGDVPHLRCGRKYLLDLHDLERLIESWKENQLAGEA